ncbi:MAG: helix-turn-helix domain-containing protein [Desulfotalea sp.]
MKKCALCNGLIEELLDYYPFKTKHLGLVQVPNINYEKCSNCSDITVSIEQSEIIRKYAQEVERKIIASFPISDFISGAEAIELLGISKQAFSKNPKIKRGFIYSVKIGNRRFYHRKSVIRFNESKNGRFKLKNEGPVDWTKVVDMRERSQWRPAPGSVQTNITTQDNREDSNDYISEA